MTLTEMRSLLVKRDIQLTRSLGRIFCTIKINYRKLVAAAELSPNDKVLEIGPGLGPLTELLLEKAGEVLAIETDARLVDFLCERFGTEQRDSELLDGALKNSAAKFGQLGAFHLLHDDALAFLKREGRDLERLEACGEPAIFRRLADFGGTRVRHARAKKDCRHAANGSRQTADGAGG